MVVPPWAYDLIKAEKPALTGQVVPYDETGEGWCCVGCGTARSITEFGTPCECGTYAITTLALRERDIYAETHEHPGQITRLT